MRQLGQCLSITQESTTNMASTLTQTIDSLTQKVGILGVRGSTQPIPRNHSLDKWKSFEVTPFIGQEFGSDIQLSQIVNAPNADELIKDLAVLSE